MNTKKRGFIIITFIVLILVIMMTKVKATNEKIKMFTKDDEYIIYIEGYESTSFKFAFSKDVLTSNQANENLTFINSIKDSDKTEAAYLDNTMELYNLDSVYLYAKTLEGEYILTGEKLNLKDALSKDTIKRIENLTTIIKVETQNTTTTETNKEGVAITKTIGQIDIKDDNDAKYSYQIIKIDDKASKEATDLMNTVKNTLKTSYNTMKNIDKIEVISKVNDNLETLIKKAKWNDVTNMQISQPLDTIDGDEYIVLIKKVTTDGATIFDAQFLTSKRVDTTKKVPDVENRVVTVDLPKTYDSIALFIVLMVIVVLVAIIYIRIKMLEKKQNENK